MVAELDGRIRDEQGRQIAAFSKQSAALDKHAELLAEQTRVAVEALHLLAPSKVRGDAAPSGRDTIDGPSSMQGGAKKGVVAGSEATRTDEPLGAKGPAFLLF